MTRKVVSGATRATCICQMADFAVLASSAISKFLANTNTKAQAPDRAPAASLASSLAMEQLEDRCLLSGVTFSNGVLTLSGANGQSNSLFVDLSGSTITAHENSVSKSVANSNVKSIVINGGDGKDTIRIASGITAPSTINAGAGNDYISGGGGNDTVWGSTGNDTMYGNGGNDQLHGDDGTDYLDGGSGSNTLDGGAGTDVLKNGTASSSSSTSSTSSTSTSSSTTTSSAASISALELWNADTDTKIETISSGMSLDLAALPAHLTLVAQGSGASVKFGLDSSSSYHVESQKPWAIGGDNSGNLVAWTIPTGSHTIKLTPYTKSGATGTAGTAKTFSLNVTRSSSSSGSTTSNPAASISALELWNADTDTKIESLSSGMSLDLTKLPSHLTLVAQGTGSSVKFGLDSSSSYRVESAKPWAIAGDNSGNLVAWSIPTGSHTIKLTPYTKSGASGTAGATVSYSFNFSRSTSSSTTGGTTTGSTGSTSTGGIVPRDNSASAPSPVITVVSSKTIHAGQSIDVNATSSSLNSGTPLTARYVWDFGDSGSAYNILEGFNAAHVYSKAGTYTVKLTLTNQAGKTATASTTITVNSAGRKVYYVSTSGSDSNAGTSSSAPIKTFAKAISKLADNVEIDFNGGQTFSVSQAMTVYHNNVVIGSYGSGKATLKYTGSLNYTSMIYLGGQGHGENTVQNLTFTSGFSDTQKDGMPQGVGVGGKGDAVLNCQFLDVGYGVNAAAEPTGLLVQGHSAPDRAGVKEYFVWSEGSDVSIVGNTVANVLFGHDIRSAGTDRLLIAYNSLSNPNDPQYGDNVNRGTINIHKGSYEYVAHNNFTQGVTSIGPLNLTTGIDDKAARLNWTVFEDNTINDSFLLVMHGTQHVMIRNNVINQNNSFAIELQGYSTLYARGVVDATIVNNTAVNSGTQGNFIHVDGPVDGINLVNNLYDAPNLITGTNGSAPVFVFDNDLSSFNEITGNVWPSPTVTLYAAGGINYVWPTWSNASGYKTPAEWASYGVVGTDHFSDISFNTSTDAPSTSSVAANAGIVWDGVFTDKNGKLRSATGSWTAGAVEV